jgi:2-amino-4-hydroxy-6-hydroxymethyldihydropteridine diphosphokinase
MKTVYLSLGSNVGDREAMLQAAIDELHAPDLRVVHVSPVYETEPMDVPNQRWFLNLVLEGQTDLFPKQLLARIQKIEQRLGRRRTTPKGPRTIDIDIVFYGNFVIRTPSLVIPHERFAQRSFVLTPMVELAPNLRDPVSRRSMRDLLAQTTRQTVRMIDFRPVIPSLQPTV